MKNSSRLLTMIVLGIVVACSSPTEVELRERMADLDAAIVALIGDPLCDSVDECRYIGFGQKACGGPWGYLVYSISQTDSLQLTILVDEHRLVTKEWNAKYGGPSTCDLPSAPTLGRRDGRCVDLDKMSQPPGT